MPNFAFQARDRSGEIVSGTREAGDQRQALEALREAGLFVTRLQAAPATAKQRGAENVRPETAVENRSGAATPSSSAPSHSGAAAKAKAAGETNWVLRANAKDLSLFFRQMHAMIHAGTSLGQALNIMAQHGTTKSIRRISGEMSLHAQRGGSISEAMRAYPGVFSGLAVGMVEAGERGGVLESVFQRLADYLERDYELQQIIKRETAYPKLLLFCSFLIPSAVPLVLGGWGAWWISVQTQIFILVAGFAGWRVLGFFSPLLRDNVARQAIDFVKLCVPGMSRVVRGLAASKFCRALGALYGAGVSPQRAVALAAAACGNLHIQRSVMSVAPALERGQSISEALGATKQFPPIAMHILHTGEATGTLDTQLDKVADFMESDAETSIKVAVKWLGVLVFLVVAMIIGVKVVEFYSGTYSQMMDSAEQLQP